MAKEQVPDPLIKRELLHSDKPVDCLKYGDLFFDRQRYNDAADFYAKGGLKDSLRKLKDIAAENGDFFLLKRLVKLLPGEVEDADWEKLALSARSNGKENFAVWADEERGKRGASGGHEGEEP